jgi:flagellar motor switch protein FliG
MSLEKINSIEYLKRIHRGGIQLILGKTDQKDLAFILSNAPKDIVNLFMNNVSKRLATKLEEDIVFYGEISEGKIAEARSKFLDHVNRRLSTGEIAFLEPWNSCI